MVKLTSNVNRLEHTFIILQNKKPNKKKFSFNKGLINKHMSNKTKPNKERESFLMRHVHVSLCYN